MIKNKALSLVLAIAIACAVQAYGQQIQTKGKDESITVKGDKMMTNLNYNFKINASAGAVWEIVGDLKGCDKWIPGITSAVMDGNNRTCTTADGNVIKEVITEHSDEKRFYSYTQSQVPMPVKDSKGTFQVIPDGEGSKIIWNVEFQLLDPATKNEMVPMIDGYYKQTLENLKKIVEGGHNLNEFMIFITAEGNPVMKLSPEAQQQHIQKVGAFIEDMVNQGIMKAAQPLEMSGRVLSGEKGHFTDGPFVETKESIAGYYLITVENMDEAIRVAKADPRFDDAKWQLEIRPIMKVSGINN